MQNITEYCMYIGIVFCTTIRFYVAIKLNISFSFGGLPIKIRKLI